MKATQTYSLGKKQTANNKTSSDDHEWQTLEDFPMQTTRFLTGFRRRAPGGVGVASSNVSCQKAAKPGHSLITFLCFAVGCFGYNMGLTFNPPMVDLIIKSQQETRGASRVEGCTKVS